MSEQAEYAAERKLALAKLKELLPMLVDISKFYYNINFELEENYTVDFETYIYHFIDQLDIEQRTQLSALVSELQYDLDTIAEDNGEGNLECTPEPDEVKDENVEPGFYCKKSGRSF